MARRTSIATVTADVVCLIALLDIHIVAATPPGIVLVDQSRADLALGGPTGPDEANAQVTLERDLARSRLTVIPASANAGVRPVVSLGKPTSTTDVADEGGRFQPLMPRELIRQAVLIAARDELGLVARDEVIGDSPLDGPDQATAEVASVFRVQSGQSRVLVRRGGDGKGEQVLKRDLEGSPAEFGYLPKLTVLAESLSRNEFPAALKGINLNGKANAWRESAPLPAAVDDRLKTLGFIDNLTAARDLHELIRSDGESAPRLGALVRAYAQLGVASEFQWHPAHKAYKARALLYAQRLVARDPASPWGLWNQAFALALVGLPKDAQADLDLASTLAAKMTPRPASPAWVAVIEAYLAHNTQRLRLEAGPEQKLAALLCMLVSEFPTWTTVALQSAKEVVTLDPECSRAHDLMCQIGGVTNLHVTTELGPRVLSELVPEKLKTMPSIPRTVQETLGRDGNERGWIEALDKAGHVPGDLGEPSWGALAHLVRETRFVQIYRRLDFLRFKLVVPVKDFWKEAQADVAEHRYRAYLESFSQPQQQNLRTYREMFRNLDTTVLECTEVPLIQELLRADPVKGARIWMSTQSHSDAIVRDVSLLIAAAPVREDLLKHARALLEISPNSAFAMLNLLYSDWDANKSHVKQWLALVGDAPPILWALGKKYSDLKQYNDAQEYLRRFIRQSPDSAAYELLASNYKAAGDRKLWKQTLDEILDKVEDHGLDHARVRVQIANDFMDHQQWEEARPYADAAAETWAQWAMLCASRCYEGLKAWDRAEQWIMRMDERYPNAAGTDWYRFCKRTGHGDLEAARTSTQTRFDAIGSRADLATLRTAGYFYWSISALDKARDALQESAAIDTLESSLLLDLALIADQRGDKAQREEKLESLWTNHQGQAPRMNQVCRIFRKWIAAGFKDTPDLSFVKTTVEKTDPNHRDELEFFVGRFLTNHGRPEAARPYLVHVIDSASANGWLKILAADALSGPTKKSPENSPKSPK